MISIYLSNVKERHIFLRVSFKCVLKFSKSTVYYGDLHKNIGISLL